MQLKLTSNFRRHIYSNSGCLFIYPKLVTISNFKVPRAKSPKEITWKWKFGKIGILGNAVLRGKKKRKGKSRRPRARARGRASSGSEEGEEEEEEEEENDAIRYLNT